LTQANDTSDMTDKRPSSPWRENILRSPLAAQLMSDADLNASISRALRSWDGSSDLWLFAYGSLIWSPQVRFEEQRVGTVHGYHRRFCLWSRINRGTPERPGLVLGLDRGGCCGGLAYRIAADNVRAELHELWEREMLLGSYHPTWVNFRAGGKALRTLAFVVNRGASGYTGRLPENAMLEALQTACGRYGSCADYLLRTADSLRTLGIADRQMQRLRGQLLGPLNTRVTS
jgi:glutathione-specific gamma-glutamylcyclotransferase